MMARSGIRLFIRQQPLRAQVVQENNPKNRKPIDPPPIIELKYENQNDPQNSQWLVSPRTFMMVTLIAEKEGDEPVPGKYLIGQTVSSLHRLKDINNKDGGFFVFGDISARKLGRYKLRFSLFDTEKESEEVYFMGAVDSQAFPVLPQRDFGSMSESTHLTRTFSDQGVKLRVRKDNRAISGIGSKRSYNASPPETTSPGLHQSMYGGAVQDHHYSHTQSPAAKRHRSSSEYDNSHLYLGDNHLSHYGSAIPSTTRGWAGSDHSRGQSGYSQQQSPLGMSMMGRVPASLGSQVQTPGWQGMNQASALPSPASTVSNQQQQSYPSVTSQQQSSSLFGDPGSASSIPRNYYDSNYQYQSNGQYRGPPSGEVQSSYSDLNPLPTSAIPDTAGLASSQTPGYSSAYLPYGSEPSEVQGAYAYMDNQKF